MQGPLSAGPREPTPQWDTPQVAPVPTAHTASSRQTPGPKAGPAPHPDLLTLRKASCGAGRAPLVSKAALGPR